ncbi:MAG: acyl carrier protein [Clostridia bacterium]|nr:acyl carrier protein [Clostridia bacterium]
MDVQAKVIEIVANVCTTDVTNVTLESSIGDFPDWDSMGHLAILQQVEESLEINFDPEEMMDLEDVSDIIKAVKAKL